MKYAIISSLSLMLLLGCITPLKAQVFDQIRTPEMQMLNQEVEDQIDTALIRSQRDTALTKANEDKAAYGHYKYREPTPKAKKTDKHYWYEVWTFQKEGGQGAMVIHYAKIANETYVKMSVLCGSISCDTLWTLAN